MKTKDKMLNAGIRMAALAAAGNYFVYGSGALDHRGRVTGWALQLKGEVLQGMAALDPLDQASYDALVEKTVRRYERVKQIRPYEARNITNELKSAWHHIGRTLA